ncbi:putative spermidine/putrescine transport system permease protein [Hydrogenispora ethanolica]|jgi:putative spermidine/putrescine transport system permease protein|uniref:Putative spermidine/putrescine transport system permease protein n=1 Tax=Hydrogenispora ethanolica TaxID=1082276 RepID=A0A4V2QFU5_HYDET|nr:ABC transporter permease subunit [Hydrogenispora ethanolica]TCL73307.1 putative spermidine/putrescine transport system permease protein [Hydrogenispora ethanolica]
MRWLDWKGFYHALGRKRFGEWLIFTAFLLFFFGPLVNLTMLAFSQDYLYPKFFPSALSLKWWQFVLSQQNLAGAMILSFIVAIVTTLASALICLPAAYAFARIDFPLRRFCYASFLLTNAFPKMGLYVTIGMLFYKLNLMGSFPGVIIIHLINTMMYMTWIPAGAFSSVHRQQEEAARDVGASPWQTFRHVTLPLAMPGIMVAAIFTFLTSLEEAQGTLLVGVPNVKTIPVVMYSVIFDYPAMAGAVFSIILVIPTVILLLLMRKSAGGKSLAQGLKGFN